METCIEEKKRGADEKRGLIIEIFAKFPADRQFLCGKLTLYGSISTKIAQNGSKFKT